jgi:NAD(P)H dehydrogenase (quinone)
LAAVKQDKENPMPKILVLYYSMYGNVFKMAQAVAEGARQVKSADVAIKTVAELIPDKVIQGDPALLAGKKLQEGVPVATVDDLAEADAVLLGSPTRFGNMCAQMRNFWDRTTKLWLSGGLIGKPAGVFCSTASLHGGQETTLISMMFTLLHHGMIIVGVPYSVPELISTTQGGTPYGPSHTAGPTGDMGLTAEETTICRALGARVAGVAEKLGR